jgi:hypothetical protein
MYIYFTGSLSGKKQHGNNYMRIIEYLVSRGHTVIADHIMSTSEDTVRKSSRKEKHEFQKRVEAWIENCDCVIAETSQPSVSVGYEIGLALQMNKSILIMHSPDTDPPSLFGDHESENVVATTYSRDNYSRVVEDFLHFAQNNHDVKFTFYIPPRHAHYLDKVSKRQKISKSAYLRELIEIDLHISHQ